MKVIQRLNKKGIQVVRAEGSQEKYDCFSKGEKLNGRSLTPKELDRFEKTVWMGDSDE